MERKSFFVPILTIVVFLIFSAGCAKQAKRPGFAKRHEKATEIATSTLTKRADIFSVSAEKLDMEKIKEKEEIKELALEASILAIKEENMTIESATKTVKEKNQEEKEYKLAMRNAKLAIEEMDNKIEEIRMLVKEADILAMEAEEADH